MRAAPAFPRGAAWALLLLALTGCASVALPPASPGVERVEKLRAARLQPARAGSFVLAAARNAEMDRSLGGLRGVSLSPPQGSLALHPRDELVAALKAAGLHDEKSALVIEAELTESQVDAAIGTGTARLAARSVVRRGGAKVYDQERVAQSQWESSFVGAVAVPLAINQYTALYMALFAKLVEEADFRAALARQATAASDPNQIAGFITAQSGPERPEVA